MPIVTDVVWSVCVSPAKMAELMVMPFGAMYQLGAWIPHGTGTVGAYLGWGMPMLIILNVICKALAISTVGTYTCAIYYS